MINTHVFCDSLADLRSQIDNCDDELLCILKKRMDIVTNVAALKSKNNVKNFIRPAREAQVMQRILSQSTNLSPYFILSVWRTLMMGALQHECQFTVGYVGTSGLLLSVQVFGGQSQYTECKNYDQLISQYCDGIINYIVLPFDDNQKYIKLINNIDGNVLFHLPLLAQKSDEIKGIVFGDTNPERSGNDFSWYLINETSIRAFEHDMDDKSHRFVGYSGRIML